MKSKIIPNIYIGDWFCLSVPNLESKKLASEFGHDSFMDFHPSKVELWEHHQTVKQDSLNVSLLKFSLCETFFPPSIFPCYGGQCGQWVEVGPADIFMYGMGWDQPSFPLNLSLNSHPLQSSAVQCSAVQWVQHTTGIYSAVQCSAVQYSSV